LQVRERLKRGGSVQLLCEVGSFPSKNCARTADLSRQLDNAGACHPAVAEQTAEGKLKLIGGSKSDEFNNTVVNQAINALWVAHSDETARGNRRSATGYLFVIRATAEPWRARTRAIG
jgi:hypothetical protein